MVSEMSRGRDVKSDSVSELSGVSAGDQARRTTQQQTSSSSDVDEKAETSEPAQPEFLEEKPAGVDKVVDINDTEYPEFARGKWIVGWDGENDPHYPPNWPLWKKLGSTLIISLDTTSMYMGAAIITPAEQQLEQHFHTTRVKTMLGLTLFVWGYGIGSLWTSPMAELPGFRGRNPIYLVCQLIFTCLQIPTGLVNHIAPFATLRFVAGLFASPPLATAGATLGDMWKGPAHMYSLIVWAYGAIAGPFLGPLIGAALSVTHGWRYIFWFMIALAGGFFVILLVLMPETSEQELLMRKARRLRKETGDDRYIAPGEILMKTQTTSQVLKIMFLRPVKLTAMEPVLMLMDIHLGLIYSVMYLFMEGLPIVYLGTYGFTEVQMGLAFMSFLVGAAIATVLFFLYSKSQMSLMLKRPIIVFARSSIFGACLLPVGLLIWGWLERKDIYWVIGMIGNLFFSVGAFFMFQSYFSLLGAMFPPSVVGSTFASSNIVRSLMGGAFPLFGTVFFEHTATRRYPVGWGCSILALGAICMIPLPVYLYFRGEKMREYAIRKYGENKNV